MKTAISFSFIFITTYVISVFATWLPAALFFATSLPLMLIYLVYKVLRDPHEPQQKFEDQFYQDYPYQRNNLSL